MFIIVIIIVVDVIHVDGGDSSRPKSFAMLRGDKTSDVAGDMRPRSDSLPDQSATVGSKRKSILKKEAMNREEIEGLLGSSRNSFAGTPGRSAAAVTADNVDDDDDDDQLVVRHLPRLTGGDDDPPRRVHPLYVSQLPTSQSVATIAEFDTDCDEESSVEGELDCVRKPSASAAPSRPRTDRVSTSRPKHQGACGGEGDGAPPLDNVRSPQNANVPLSTDINLNPPSSAGVAPQPVMRARARDKLGNHLPRHGAGVPPPRGQGATDDTTAFKHNLFPTLDFIDEFAD